MKNIAFSVARLYHQEKNYRYYFEKMQKEKDFGMRLMRRDFWSGFWKRHKDYR